MLNESSKKRIYGYLACAFGVAAIGLTLYYIATSGTPVFRSGLTLESFFYVPVIILLIALGNPFGLGLWVLAAFFWWRFMSVTQQAYRISARASPTFGVWAYVIDGMYIVSTTLFVLACGIVAWEGFGVGAGLVFLLFSPAIAIGLLLSIVWLPFRLRRFEMPSWYRTVLWIFLILFVSLIVLYVGIDVVIDVWRWFVNIQL